MYVDRQWPRSLVRFQLRLTDTGNSPAYSRQQALPRFTAKLRRPQKSKVVLIGGSASDISVALKSRRAPGPNPPNVGQQRQARIQERSPNTSRGLFYKLGRALVLRPP